VGAVGPCEEAVDMLYNAITLPRVCCYVYMKNCLGKVWIFLTNV
jgi:hypothetical protein